MKVKMLLKFSRELKRNGNGLYKVRWIDLETTSKVHITKLRTAERPSTLLASTRNAQQQPGGKENKRARDRSNGQVFLINFRFFSSRPRRSRRHGIHRVKQRGSQSVCV